MTAGRYRFRPASLADLELIRGWQAEPHVRAWWGEDPVFDAADLADPRVALWIVETGGLPFAFLQDYDVKGWAGHHFGYLPDGSRGIDQFIGEPGMLGHGHGSAFIAERVRQMLDQGVPAVGTDPHPANARAIACYAKVGFRIAGPEEDTPWGRIIRMELWSDRG